MIKISTGSEDLNNFLKGYNLITTIYGSAGTGKTTLAMLAAITQAKYNKKVIFIDTENGFSLERLKQLFPDYNEILKNIFVIRPKNFEDQEKIILNLPKNISLIIIDTIGSYYRMKVREDNYTTNKSLDKQLNKLKELSKKTPILINNQVYSDTKGNINVIGGNMLRNWSDNIIKLEKEPRKLKLEKPESKEFLFEIKNNGIYKTNPSFS